MKLIAKSIMIGLAASALAVVACSSQTQPQTSTKTTQDDNTGSVGFHLTLPGGEIINTVSYTITGVAPTTGTIGPVSVNVASSTSISFVVGGIAPGTYNISVTGVTTDGLTTCTGTSATFTVAARTAVSVSDPLTCTTVNNQGTIVVTNPTNNCPQWGTIVANPSTPTLVAPNNTSLITASNTTGPNPAGLTYAWTKLSGTGTLGAPTLLDPADDTILFTCPAVSETDVIQLVVADGPVTPVGFVCPASGTTTTVTIICGNPAPCLGVGTGVEVTGNSATGTCPALSTNTGTLKDAFGNFCCSTTPACHTDTGGLVGDGVEVTGNSATGTCTVGTNSGTLKDEFGNFCCTAPLSPCTTAGQTGCVSCGTAAAPTVCTQTEAFFVNIDISLGNVTAPGADSATGCYATLTNDSCLDHGHVTGKECDDLGTGSFTAANGTTAPALGTCLAALACEAGSVGAGCAVNAQGITTCLCGAANEPATTCSALSSTTSFTGSCASLELAGFGPPNVAAPGTPSSIILNYTDTSEPTGMANNIISCITGQSTKVTQCGTLL